MKNTFMMALLAGAALVGSMVAANADVIGVRVRNGASQVQTISGAFSGTSTVSQSSANFGNVSYSLSATGGNFSANDLALNVTTNSTNLTATTKGFEYWASVTGLTKGPLISDIIEDFVGTNDPGATTTIQIYVNTNNLLFSTQSLIYTSGTCAYSGSYTCDPTLSAASLPSTPFSITERIFVNYRAAGVGIPIGGTSSFSAIPEPASLALLGSGLLLAGLMFRRRRNDKVA